MSCPCRKSMTSTWSSTLTCILGIYSVFWQISIFNLTSFFKDNFGKMKDWLSENPDNSLLQLLRSSTPVWKTEFGYLTHSLSTRKREKSWIIPRTTPFLPLIAKATFCTVPANWSQRLVIWTCPPTPLTFKSVAWTLKAFLTKLMNSSTITRKAIRRWDSKRTLTSLTSLYLDTNWTKPIALLPLDATIGSWSNSTWNGILSVTCTSTTTAHSLKAELGRPKADRAKRL